MKNLSEVTAADCGVWVAGASVNNPLEFSVGIVELAKANGFDTTEQWEIDKPKILAGDIDFDTLDSLSLTTDSALEFLNSESGLPDGFYFDFNDGLCLFFEQPENN